MTKKISDLQQVSTFNNADLIPLVQSGETKVCEYETIKDTIINSHTSLGFIVNNSLTGTQNSYDIGNNRHILFIAAGTITFNGISGGSTGKILRISAGVNMTLVFNQESTQAASSERVRVGQSSLTVTNRGVTFVYSGNRWWMV